MSRRSERLFEALNEISQQKVDEAAPVEVEGVCRKHGGRTQWLGAVAAVLAAAIAVGTFLRPGGGLDAYAIAQARYPDTYMTVQLTGISDPEGFFARSAQVFLTQAEGENRVYSPLNVYLALSMLAQITDGSSREQILELLGSSSMDTLRGRAHTMWNANYRDDEWMTSILASSLWLDQDVKFDQDTMDILAQDFYASSYAGEMGSAELNKALRDWLSGQTGGLLKKQAGNIKLNGDTALALASTLYFKAPWTAGFDKALTVAQTFHAPGGDVRADFMRQRSVEKYYWGDGFTAVNQTFAKGGAMWFLLPDEGTSPEELLAAGGEAADFLFSANKYQWDRQEYLYINKSVPKFDVASQFDLGDGLRSLGVTDVYDPAASDFTPMTSGVDAPIILDQTSHAARVMIDEEGCTAAAFTELAVCRLVCDPINEVDFVLDRPFLFCVTGDSGLPLLVGIVNYPGGR